MNFLLQNPNSKPITNKNNVGTTIQIIQITKNRKRIFLPVILTDIIGFKVRSVSWAVPPVGYSGSSIFYLCSEDLVENTINQSIVITADPADPSGSTQEVVQRSIIASWVPQEFPPFSWNTINYSNPNYEPTTIWLKKPLKISDIEFTFESDTNEIVIDVNTKLILVMEFYYYLETCT